jgi:hypothetical protein
VRTSHKPDEERKVFQAKVEVGDLVVRRGKQTTFAPLPYLLVFLVCVIC